MATPAYTTRLAWVSQSGPVDQVLYTVPAGRRVIIRDIVYVIPTVGNTLNIYVALPGSSIYSLLYVAGVDAYSRRVEMRQALHAGDQLVVGYPGTDNLFLSVTAYDLVE